MIDLFFAYLTNISGVAGALVTLLIVYGFRRYINRPRTAPIDYIGTGIWVLGVVFMSRMFFWDLIPNLAGINWRADFGVSAVHVNWVFNLGVVLGMWLKLKGFYLLVNSVAPGRYNILTAVFYAAEDEK